MKKSEAKTILDEVVGSFLSQIATVCEVRPCAFKPKQRTPEAYSVG